MTAAAFIPIVTQAGLNAAARAQTAGEVLQIDHIAIGDGAWTPDGSATALRQERARVPVSRRRHVEGSVWEVAGTVTGDGDYFAREIGFYADDGGTPVLMFVHAHEAEVFAGVTRGQDTLFELHVSLAAIPEGAVAFSFLDADLTLSEMVEDMRGLHEEDGQFNFALTQSVEQHLWIAMERFESEAQIRRGYGQSGIRLLRHYGDGGDAAWHRPSAVNFAALGAHNHPNYPLMCGMPEISAVVNGYEVNTRHIDYRIVRGLEGGGYLEVEDATPPAPPPSVLAKATPEAQMAEMAEYLRAYARHDASIRPYREHFDIWLSVLEVWLEELAGDALADTFPSFRHQLSRGSHRRMANDYTAMLGTGIKPRFENNDLKPTVVRVMRPDGQPQFAVLRYRVSAIRLGTYADYPAHRMTEQVDDPATRQRFGVSDAAILRDRRGRFRVVHGLQDRGLARRREPGLLDEIMGRMPGLDGPGALIEESYSDTRPNGGDYTRHLMDWRVQGRLNGAFYKRFYGYLKTGASGRKQYRFGFNDPMLFRAATTREEVTALPGLGGGHRMSWAIPLELVVASPLGAWNPYEVPIREEIPGGSGETHQAAHPHAARDRYWYLTPTDLFRAGARGDPADTDQSAWMTCGDGRARLMRGAGVYLFTPRLANAPAEPPARMRWPIAPVHHEGSFEFGHIEARRREMLEAVAANAHEILKMKHTAWLGGHNGA